MLVFLLLSLELHISPNPIEGKVGERIPFVVRVLDREGRILEGDLSFNVIPGSLGRVQDNTFIASEEGRGVLRCRIMKEGKQATGFAYIKIGGRESAKILPPIAILKEGEQVKFTVTGGTAKEWKCIPGGIGTIRNGVFTAKNSGRGRVIAILTNGEIKTAFIRVSGKVSDIQITPRFKRIEVGEKAQFEAKEKGRVTWRVEGENIGEINSGGIFTAKLPGKAVIVAEKKGSEGRAIVVVSGEVGLRITPESVTLKTGERALFKVNAEGFGNVNIPVSWKVVPERCGKIRKDGTFIAGKVPTKGRVIALLPERFGKGVVSANVFVTSDKIKSLEMTPDVRQFEISDIGSGFQFRVSSEREIALRWRVIPEDLGSVNNSGIFIPRRPGIGFLIAEPQSDLSIKPATATIIIGEEHYLRDSVLSYPDDGNGETTVSIPVHIEFSFPSQQVIEGFKIPITINKSPDYYRVKWKVVPSDAGRIIPISGTKAEFQANKLPDEISIRNVKVFAILHKGRNILAWASKEIRVIKAP